jgi:putative ABC transport system permease protein
MTQLIQDLRFAVRMLARNRGFTAVVVLTLALAIGANSSVFSIVNAVVLHHLPYAQSDRLVMLWERNTSSGGDLEKLSGPDLLEWQSRGHSFEGMARWTSWGDIAIQPC